jgi:uncharacterized membrane protein
MKARTPGQNAEGASGLSAPGVPPTTPFAELKVRLGDMQYTVLSMEAGTPAEGAEPAVKSCNGIGTLDVSVSRLLAEFLSLPSIPGRKAGRVRRFDPLVRQIQEPLGARESLRREGMLAAANARIRALSFHVSQLQAEEQRVVRLLTEKCAALEQQLEAERNRNSALSTAETSPAGSGSADKSMCGGVTHTRQGDVDKATMNKKEEVLVGTEADDISKPRDLTSGDTWKEPAAAEDNDVARTPPPAPRHTAIPAAATPPLSSSASRPLSASPATRASDSFLWTLDGICCALCCCCHSSLLSLSLSVRPF